MRESGEELPQGAIQNGSTHSREGPFLRFQVGRWKASEAKYVHFNLTFLYIYPKVSYYLYLTALDRIGSRVYLAEIFFNLSSQCGHIDDIYIRIFCCCNLVSFSVISCLIISFRCAYLCGERLILLFQFCMEANETREENYLKMIKLSS